LFHHLRPSAESDQRRLEETARNTLKLLNDLEREFFGFAVKEGMVVPDHPEYWSIKDGEPAVAGGRTDGEDPGLGNRGAGRGTLSGA